jgi:putative oxidoreductase
MLDRISAFAPQMLSVLRIVSGLTFLLHGTQKLVGIPAAQMQPPLMLLFGAAGIIELVAGALIIAGFYSRLAAFIAAGEMAVAYWMIHAPNNLFPTNNGGDAAILYCFIFLYLVVAGPGIWRVNRY